MFNQHFRTNEELGALYSVEDLLRAKLSGDDLTSCIHNWDAVIAGMSHVPEEITLRAIFLRELRKSTKRKHDLETYKRAKDGTKAHVPLADSVSKGFAQSGEDSQEQATDCQGSWRQVWSSSTQHSQTPQRKWWPRKVKLYGKRKWIKNALRLEIPKSWEEGHLLRFPAREVQ